ncbi:MAG: threonine--tRNA ligase [Candidatus Yonathbacteria bacterium RIFOXYC1_FULL_52_10]|uniref:Threonine--tRNA ligase n=1 Tax=Candidatus Yonathbacteria bacterium RIFOXYD1_FULL_52_36 TaxID=1802730 RepID=A0A1G2SMV4_9BACT|nr:MAG: threonine--tRNA ligase [Candidatus Yonathbacteria bacterium RIFOXYC1_FULL_52_10]OHA86306.1 MAG: threonine--tRNA ligase [Candidatus Yonathbacteria bacterium RIFOXYD1_FULL_52_36]
MEPTENLTATRHSLAHLLAAAVQRLYPTAKRAIGPAIENGFYYDFEFAEPISDKDLGKIEKEMRKTLATWSSFTRSEKTPDEAREYFKENPYKLELIDEIVGKGESITFYESSPYFTDLCRGGHADDMSTIDPDSFTLSRIAGAYWRGDEKNAMLTRIYGLAFENKEALDAYLKQQEEAKKRDHRKLGKELELFTIIDEIGPGLPLFYPNGTILRRLVERYIEDEQEKRGYVPIWIPHITKGELYKISGHLDKYDAMYTPMRVDEDDYYLKPMNCPHFMMLYRSLPHSYRELPLRYTSTTTNYRYEKSGELSGLTRVRALTQDDCHVFVTPDQIEDEIKRMLDMIGAVYQRFGLTDFWVRISLRDSKNKEGYLGDDTVWQRAEDALRSVVKATGWKYDEADGEAAFYGPKLDFMFKDAIGRQWQLSTIQLDWNLPGRFELEYSDKDGGKSRPVVIHRAILGSTERFLGVMIEHFSGAFPLWLSPVQATILPVSEKTLDYAKEVQAALRAEGFRVDVDDRNESLGKKIRENKIKKTPYLLVVGEKEVDTKTVSAESRDHGQIGALSLEDLVARFQKETSTEGI